MAKSVEDCIKEHGRVWSLEVGQEFKTTVAFRKPLPPEWRRYVGGVSSAKLSEDGTHIVDANEDLCKAVTVSHSPTELDAIAVDDLNVFMDLAKQIGSVVTGDKDLLAKKHVPASTKP